MPAHAINREAFEFTCKSEDTAKSVQHEIEHYTLFRINDIITSVLSEYTEDTHCKIDQVEIDLGDIPLKDFGNDDMLEKFKKVFSEKIGTLYTERNYFPYSNGLTRSRTVDNAENEFEIIRTFLLHGD